MTGLTRRMYSAAGQRVMFEKMDCAIRRWPRRRWRLLILSPASPRRGEIEMSISMRWKLSLRIQRDHSSIHGKVASL